MDGHLKNGALTLSDTLPTLVKQNICLYLDFASLVLVLYNLNIFQDSTVFI